MLAEEVRQHLLNRPEAWEDYPFGDDVAVFKIGKKMFATLGFEAGVARINLKCAPEEALFLRDMFEAIRPGYHMNKNHWNTVLLDGSIPRSELERMMDASFTLVVRSMSRAERQHLILTHGEAAIYH